MKTQSGFAHLFVIFLSFLGIILGAYLVTHPTIFLSHASNPPIVFKDIGGSALTTNSSGVAYTSSPTVRVDFTSTLGGPCSSVSTPSSKCTSNYRYAEDPNTLLTATYTSYTTEPTIITSYTFKDPTPGPKFIFVEFKANDGTTDQRSSEVLVQTSDSTQTPTASAGATVASSTPSTSTLMQTYTATGYYPDPTELASQDSTPTSAASSLSRSQAYSGYSGPSAFSLILQRLKPTTQTSPEPVSSDNPQKNPEIKTYTTCETLIPSWFPFRKGIVTFCKVVTRS